MGRRPIAMAKNMPPRIPIMRNANKAIMMIFEKRERALLFLGL